MVCNSKIQFILRIVEVGIVFVLDALSRKASQTHELISSILAKQSGLANKAGLRLNGIIRCQSLKI
jgi:hypothetical protein